MVVVPRLIVLSATILFVIFIVIVRLLHLTFEQLAIGCHKDLDFHTFFDPFRLVKDFPVDDFLFQFGDLVITRLRLYRNLHGLGKLRPGDWPFLLFLVARRQDDCDGGEDQGEMPRMKTCTNFRAASRRSARGRPALIISTNRCEPNMTIISQGLMSSRTSPRS